MTNSKMAKKQIDNTHPSIYFILLLLISLILIAPHKAILAQDSNLKASSKVALPPEKAAPIIVPQFETPPVIDGNLSDAIWTKAAVFKDFYQTRPGDNIAPSRQTEVLIGYDQKQLYVAFHAFDEPDQIRSTIAKRDNIFDDDYVGILLDTFNDKRRAYELFFNPLGIQGDSILTEGRGEDFSFDLLMESKGAITADGFVVEVAVPFKSLRFEAGKDKLWGIHLLRNIKRFNNEQTFWLPLSRDNSSLLDQEGHITGLEGISSGRTLEIIPSLTFSETGKRIPTIPQADLTSNSIDPGKFVNKPIDTDLGVTVKFGLSSTVTLDFTYKPDFAQVEADQTVVTANQRFPIFFAEKRPFFLEGVDIFQTPINVISTRAIIAPEYAAKLTGKKGRNTFGFLVATDSAPGSFSDEELGDPTIFNDIARFVDKKAYIGVLRLKHDVGQRSNIGFLATSYNFIEKHNQVLGVDGNFKIDERTVVTFQALGTTSRRFFYDPTKDSSPYGTGNGFAYYLNYDYTGRNYGYFVETSGLSQNYRADVGFTQRTGTNSTSGFFRHSTDPNPKTIMTNWRIQNFSRISYDMQGRTQSWTDETQAQFNFKRETNISFGMNGGYERLVEEEFGPKRSKNQQGAFFGPKGERSEYNKSVFAYGSSTPTKKYSFNAFTAYTWGVFDFDFGAGPRYPRVSPAALIDANAPLDPGAGNQFEFNFGVSYQPIASLRASLDYNKVRLTRNDTGKIAFDENIYSLRTTYQLNRNSFLRLRLDYESIASNLRGQFLFGYTPSPGTSLYIGYNDDLNYNGFNPFTSNKEPGFQRNGRTFFIKMSYLIRRGL